jgi:hypothetical protein
MLLLQIDLKRSIAVVSWSIQLKDISLSDEWILEEVTQPEPIKLIRPNSYLKSMSQSIDGQAKISFYKSLVSNTRSQKHLFLEDPKEFQQQDLQKFSNHFFPC